MMEILITKIDATINAILKQGLFELVDLNKVEIHEILFVEMDTESDQNNEMMVILIMEMDAVINLMLRQGINVLVDLH